MVMTLKSEDVSGANEFKLKKLDLIERIAATESKEFIEEIEEFLRLKRIEKYEKELKTPMTLDEYRDGIDEALGELERGEDMTEEELIKSFEEEEGKSIFE